MCDTTIQTAEGQAETRRTEVADKPASARGQNDPRRVECGDGQKQPASACVSATALAMLKTLGCRRWVRLGRTGVFLTARTWRERHG